MVKNKCTVTFAQQSKFYEKVVTRKFVELFEINYFFLNINVVSRIFLQENCIFLFLQKFFLSTKPEPFVENGWL